MEALVLRDRDKVISSFVEDCSKRRVTEFLLTFSGIQREMALVELCYDGEDGDD